MPQYSMDCIYGYISQYSMVQSRSRMKYRVWKIDSLVRYVTSVSFQHYFLPLKWPSEQKNFPSKKKKKKNYRTKHIAAEITWKKLMFLVAKKHGLPVPIEFEKEGNILQYQNKTNAFLFIYFFSWRTASVKPITYLDSPVTHPLFLGNPQNETNRHLTPSTPSVTIATPPLVVFFTIFIYSPFLPVFSLYFIIII